MALFQKIINALKHNFLLILLITSVLFSTLIIKLNEINKIKNSQKTKSTEQKKEFFDSPLNHYYSIKINGNEVWWSYLSEEFSSNYVFWDGYFFKGGGSDINPTANVIKYNLITGVETIVMDSDKDNEYLGLSSLKVVNNKLIFVLSGYRERSKVYWLSSPDSKPIELKNHPDASRIEEIEGQFYIIGGFGDSCGSIYHYYLLNPITLSTKKIIESSFGCADGDELLGVFNGSFLISNHINSDKKYPAMQKYQNLEMVNMTNPDDKKILIDFPEMPENVTAITYSKDDGLLYLQGNNLLHIYNLSTQQLQPINDPFQIENVKNELTAITQKQITRKEIVDEIRQYFQELNLPPSVTVHMDDVNLKSLKD